MAHNFGGQVAASNTREYGRANIVEFDKSNELLQGVPQNSQVWMSHGDSIKTLPDDFVVIASTEDVKNAAFRSEEHTSELQSRPHLVCRLLLEKKNLHTTRPFIS